MTSRHLLLTGATGLVGQYLLRDLLLAGTPLAVIVRPSAHETAQERIERLLARWEGELGQKLESPVCLEGDLNTNGLGLKQEDRSWIQHHCGRVLHCAASLAFEGRRDTEPWRTNLTGTARLLELCQATGLRELHHVSTAYVCGQRTETIYETDLNCGQIFRNQYEHSKLEAEEMVRSAEFLESLTIYRPSVVVGDWHTGYTATYHGLYAYLQLVWVLARNVPVEKDGRAHLPIRLTLIGNEKRNLIPVDWVSAVLAHLVLSAEHHGQTYHLTPTHPTTVAELEEAMARFYRYHGPTFVGPDGLDEKQWNELERLFYEHVAMYRSYWADEPTFDCTNTLRAAPHLPCPRIDQAFLHRLISFAVQDRWGKRSRRSPLRIR